jgi:hypothetical protein
MRISFDLDDTLICYDPAVPCEKSRVPWVLRHWFNEPLRQGAAELMRELAARGCRICVYTTSYRSPRQVKWWLRFYGVKVETVINEQAYRKRVPMSHFERLGKRRPSKYPPAFGIDVHVDDSEGVRIEGDEHGFAVVVVRPDDRAWCEKVSRAVDEMFLNEQPASNPP